MKAKTLQKIVAALSAVAGACGPVLLAEEPSTLTLRLVGASLVALSGAGFGAVYIDKPGTKARLQNARDSAP